MAATAPVLEKTVQGELAAREVERQEIYFSSWAWKNPLSSRYREVLDLVEEPCEDEKIGKLR